MSETVFAILAGGFSRRYQIKKADWKDKILLKVNDEPLLVNLIRRSDKFYKQRIISVNTIERKEKYQKVLTSYNLSNKIDFIVDNKSSSFSGVLLGIASILNEVKSSSVQFMPSDRPLLPFSLLKSLDVCNQGISILQYGSGLLETLLALYGANIYFPKEFGSLALSRADVLLRISPKLNFFNIEDIISLNELSPLIFRNVNVHNSAQITSLKVEEVEELKTPFPTKIVRTLPEKDFDELDEENCCDYIEKLNDLNNNYSAFLWSIYYKNRFLINMETYTDLGKKSLNSEYQFWVDNNVPFFALHALQDLLFFFPDEKTSSKRELVKALKMQMNIQSKAVNKKKE